MVRSSFFFFLVVYLIDRIRTTGSPQMRMQLIAQSEEGGPQDLPSMMQYWIENEQCIPGFLASLTLECWEGSKRARGE